MSLFTTIFKEIFSARKDRAIAVDDGNFTSPLHLQEFAEHRKLADQAFPGAIYDEWLMWFHNHLRPKNYIEIGIETGKVLAYANPPTIAIGVDPNYKIVYEMRTKTKLFKEPSDDFFRDQDLSKILEQEKLEFAFIDGLHTFDQALKDFINLERLSSPDTVILFHDIHPVIPATADRNRHTVFWIGDTWKVIAILKKYRPDLKLFSIPTYPSGLGVVTNLNPASTTLASQYDSIVAEAMEYELAPYLENMKGTLSVVNNNFDEVAAQLKLNRPVTDEQPG